jgi:hypothetical protein
MNTLLLHPTDVLFFRDGRPMTGSLAGHGAAWPMPDIINHALHAALHRADLPGVHAHRRGRSGYYSDIPEERDRKFGCLLTAGPFPVDAASRWFFPRPKDAQHNGTVKTTLLPATSPAKTQHNLWPGSSLPEPLKYAVANSCPPEKGAGGEPWISAEAFNAYLRSEVFPDNLSGRPHFLSDESIADQEAALGIAIDPETQTTGLGATEGKIYTAHYLRLREGFRLGVCAVAEDKLEGGHGEKRDLLQQLLRDHPAQIVVGGQQRICTAQLREAGRLQLPIGLARPEEFARLPNGKFGVKWVLLSPAIWPAIPEQKKDGTRQNPHPGGWLPNWVFLNWNVEKQVAEPEERNGNVLLTSGPGVRKSQRTKGAPGGSLAARLVAAIVPKPQVVTGWALPNSTDPDGGANGGAKSTHLAVPAGAVYHFEADTAAEAVKLATALNWHGGDLNPATLKNRRSTLLGEKGFGLGVCGTWQFYEDVGGRPKE